MRDLVIVDDNPLLLNVLAEMFRECGYLVRPAGDGFEALWEIRSKSPDILLSDLNMPGMSGFELLSIVRRSFPSIAVVAMSATNSGRNVPIGVAADAYYAKGVLSVSELLRMMNGFKEGAEPRARVRPEPAFTHEYLAAPDYSDVLVTCPECFRVFPRSMSHAAFCLRERYCPYCFCLAPLEVIVSQSAMEGVLSSVPETTASNCSYP